jgi:hypothetical protein
MADLLNSGWQITGHGVGRVASNGNATGASGFDTSALTFILNKGGKYILCVVEDPRPPVANSASCRKLN